MICCATSSVSAEMTSSDGVGGCCADTAGAETEAATAVGKVLRNVRREREMRREEDMREKYISPVTGEVQRSGARIVLIAAVWGGAPRCYCMIRASAVTRPRRPTRIVSASAPAE